MEGYSDQDLYVLEQAVLEALADGPLEVDQFLARFPRCQWNQILVTVDSLSRRRALRLSRPARGGYVMGLSEPVRQVGVGQSLSNARLEA